MADFFTHLGVGLALSAHAESMTAKMIIVGASALPDLGDLPLWKYALKTRDRLFRNSRFKKRKWRKNSSDKIGFIKKTWIFFRNLYSRFHQRKKIPRGTFWLYNALHNIFLPLILLIAWLALRPSATQKYCLIIAAALFVHHAVDYFTHDGRWSIRALWPLDTKWKIRIPGQFSWWDLSCPRLVPVIIMAFAVPYAIFSVLYPKFFYMIY